MTIVALPHPVSHAVFGYIEKLVSALDESRDQWRAVLVTDPDRLLEEGARVLYLRPQASLEALPLLQAIADPADPFVCRSYAYAAHCDARWRHHATLTLEAAMDREFHALAVLSGLMVRPINASARDAAEAGFIDLRRNEAPWGNAAALLSGLAVPDGEAITPVAPQRHQSVLAIGSHADRVALELVNCDGIELVHLSLAEASAMAQAGEPTEGFNSTVVLANVADCDVSARLMPWLLQQVAPGGVICGAERRGGDLEAVLGALTVHGAEEGLMFAIEGARWIASRRADRAQ